MQFNDFFKLFIIIIFLLNSFILSLKQELIQEYQKIYFLKKKDKIAIIRNCYYRILCIYVSVMASE